MSITIDEVEYSDDMSLVLGCSLDKEGPVNLPEGVKRIASKAFSNCEKINMITLPKSLERIETNAFNGCKIIDVVYNGSFENYLNIVFSNNSSNPCNAGANLHILNRPLRYAYIPVTVKEIKPFAFYGCTSLAELKMRTVTMIGAYAFSECVNLSEVIVHGEVKIDTCAFKSSGVSALELPDKTSVIAAGAFANCKQLRSVVIPKGMPIIESATFSGCTSLESVVMGNNIKRINANAFANTAIRCFQIPDSVESISLGAFYGCMNLKSLFIPKTVDGLGMDIAAQCENIEFYCEGERTFGWSDKWNRIHTVARKARAVTNYNVPRWWYEKYVQDAQISAI